MVLDGDAGVRGDGGVGNLRCGGDSSDEGDTTMGWGLCGTNDHGQETGYGVEAVCDEPGCEEAIDRGLAHVCGRMHEDSDTCHRYYCGKHLFSANVGAGGGLCSRCSAEWEKSGMLEDG